MSVCDVARAMLAPESPTKPWLRVEVAHRPAVFLWRWRSLSTTNALRHPDQVDCEQFGQVGG